MRLRDGEFGRHVLRPLCSVATSIAIIYESFPALWGPGIPLLACLGFVTTTADLSDSGVFDAPDAECTLVAAMQCARAGGDLWSRAVTRSWGGARCATSEVPVVLSSLAPSEARLTDPHGT